MKKKQKINKAVHRGEWILLGLTAAFLCLLVWLSRRPVPELPVSVRTAADRPRTSPQPDAPPAQPEAVETPPEAVAAAGDRVNLNTADADTLCTLPGIGAALAGRIIDYRETYGPFARPEDVTRVSGIGEAKYAAIADLVTV